MTSTSVRWCGSTRSNAEHGPRLSHASACSLASRSSARRRSGIIPFAPGRRTPARPAFSGTPRWHGRWSAARRRQAPRPPSVAGAITCRVLRRTGDASLCDQEFATGCVARPSSSGVTRARGRPRPTLRQCRSRRSRVFAGPRSLLDVATRTARQPNPGNCWRMRRVDCVDGEGPSRSSPARLEGAVGPAATSRALSIHDVKAGRYLQSPDARQEARGPLGASAPASLATDCRPALTVASVR